MSERASRAETGRRYDLDWLRLLGFTLVFVYHAGRFFDRGWWHLKAPQTSFWLELVNAFGAQWRLELLFLVSGAALFLSTQGKPFGDVLRTRAQRILVPFAFGVLVIVPPQVYLERVAQGHFQGSYPAFYPHYFDGFYMPASSGGNFAWHGNHLWFLLYLFVFSVVGLPLLRYGWQAAGGRAAAWLAGRFERDGCFLPGAVALVLLHALLEPRFPGHASLADGLTWFAFLALGYFAAAHPGISEALQRALPRNALWAAAGAAAWLAWYVHGGQAEPGYRAGYLAGALLSGAMTWFWLLTLVGAARRLLNRRHPWLPYLTEGVLPFYVLHQTVILLVGACVIVTDLAVGLQYAIILAGSFLGTALLYALLIRPWRLARLLFGMRP